MNNIIHRDQGRLGGGGTVCDQKTGFGSISKEKWEQVEKSSRKTTI